MFPIYFPRKYAFSVAGTRTEAGQQIGRRKIENVSRETEKNTVYTNTRDRRRPRRMKRNFVRTDLSFRVRHVVRRWLRTVLHRSFLFAVRRRVRLGNGRFDKSVTTDTARLIRVLYLHSDERPPPPRSYHRITETISPILSYRRRQPSSACRSETKKKKQRQLGRLIEQY